MADQITSQQPLGDACDVKQNQCHGSSTRACTTGCAGDRLRQERSRSSPGPALAVLRLMPVVEEPPTRKCSLCLSREAFHRPASPDSRGGDWPSGLFRALQMMSRTAKVEDQHQLRPRASHLAALRITQEMTEDSRVLAERGSDSVGVDHSLGVRMCECLSGDSNVHHI